MCHLKLFLAGCQEEFFRPYATQKLRVRTLRQETPKIYFQKSVKSAFDRDYRKAEPLFWIADIARIDDNYSREA